MSTATLPPPPRAPQEETARCEQFIDQRIASTRRDLKLVDLAATLVVLAVVTFAFLLSTAIVEHWLLAHGLPRAARYLLLIGFAGFCGWYLWRQVGPLLLRRINPDYAAQAIERENPSLKNSLLSTLQLRPQRKKMPPAVLAAVEQQAARALSSHEVDTAVDRTHLVRAGTALVVLLAAAALYAVLSPKSLMASAARTMLPWADISPPSRVRIENIEPGHAHLIQGENLELAASVRQLNGDEQVEVEITPAGGDSYLLAMRRADDDPSGYSLRLPDDPADAPLGLQQSFEYRIVAGDARSRWFAVTVDPAPTIRVTEVRYEFPKYTGYVDRTVEGLADLRAIEGTRVTIVAEANSEIAEAHLDFAADGRKDLSMRTDEQRAVVSFVLERPDDGTDPPSSYAVRYKTPQGAANREPPVHTIEVVPDLPPEIEIIAPEARVVEVAVDETVALAVEARDPDFALSRVAVAMQKANGTTLDDHVLADEPKRGRFTPEWQFTPQDLDLQPGDVVTYWATARDNRTPQAGTAETDRREIRVLGPANEQQNQNAEAGGEGPGQPQEGAGGQGDPNQGDEPGQPGEGGGEGEPNPQDAGEGGQQGDPNGQQDAEPTDGESGQAGEQDGNSDGEPGEMQEPGEAGDQQNQSNPDGGQPGESATGDNGEQSPSGDGNAGQQSPAGGENSPTGGAENGSGGTNADQPNSRVDPTGSDDASAFDRIRRHLNEQERQQAERRPSDGDSTGPSSPDTGERSEGEQQEPRPDGAQPDNATDDSNAGQREGGSEGEAPERADSATDNGEAAGNDPDTGESNTGDSAETGEEQMTGDADSTTEKPEPRSGGEGGSDSGSPEAQRDAKPRDKSQQDTGDPQGEDAAQSPGTSRHESDSEGETSGDREGGGDKGGGQQAPREGTGSDGANEAADSGNGRSADEGPGTTGDEGGAAEQADQETGTMGNETGEGAEQQPGGEQPGGEPTEQSPREGGQPGSQQPGGEGEPGERANPSDNRDANDAASGGAMPMGGEGGPGSGEDIPPGGELLAGDKANLDYAREQTDLVIESLDDQLNKKQVDQQLLDELGWTEDELRQFVDRWQTRKEAAQSGDSAAQIELDQALKALDIQPGTVGGQTQRTRDGNRNLTDGPRRETPSKFRDRLKWYTEGLSRGE